MQPHHEPQHHSFSGEHVSLGGVKYALGHDCMPMLAEKTKTPEQRYLVVAAIGGGTVEPSTTLFHRNQRTASGVPGRGNTVKKVSGKAVVTLH